MRRIVLALSFVASLLPATASAQEYVAGVYDARAIPGWVYTAEVTAVAGLPTWNPTGNSGLPPYVNCNIGYAPYSASRAEVEAYIGGLTPTDYGNSVRNSGTAVREVIATTQTTAGGYPAVSSVMSANASNFDLRFLVLQVFRTTDLITITCTTDMSVNEAAWNAMHQFARGVRYP